MPDINVNGTTLFYNDEGPKDAPVLGVKSLSIGGD